MCDKLSYDSAIMLPDIYPSELKTLHMHIYSSFIYNCQNQEQLR